MVRSLVVLGDSLTALAVARDAARKGLQVHLVTSGRGVATSTRMARVHLLPRANDDGATMELLAELARHSSSALLATSDDWLRFLIRCRAALDAAFPAVLHPGNEALTICLDKARFAAWCARHGLRTPLATVGFDPDRTPALGFPVLVRPAATRHESGAGNLPKAVEVQDARELEALLGRYAEVGASPVISESLLGGRLVQCSVGCARSPRGLLSLAARKIRPPPSACAVGTYVELRPCGPAERLARAALDALDYYGVAEVEVLYREDRDECFLIEINARPWLQYALVPASGRDFLGFLLDPGSRPARSPRDAGVRWIDAGSDVLARFRRRGTLDDEGGALRYVLSVLRANCYGTFDWTDPGPAVRSGKELVRRWWLRRRGRPPA